MNGKRKRIIKQKERENSSLDEKVRKILVYLSFRFFLIVLFIVVLILNAFITFFVVKKDNFLQNAGNFKDFTFNQNPTYDIYFNKKKEMENWDFFTFQEQDPTVNQKDKTKLFKIILDDYRYMVYFKITFAYDRNNLDLKKELDERAFEMQDEIIHLISSKSYKDISSFEEREVYLKKEILNTSNLKIDSGKIEDIFITDFFISKIE